MPHKPKACIIENSPRIEEFDCHTARITQSLKIPKYQTREKQLLISIKTDLHLVHGACCELLFIQLVRARVRIELYNCHDQRGDACNVKIKRRLSFESEREKPLMPYASLSIERHD